LVVYHSEILIANKAVILKTTVLYFVHWKMWMNHAQCVS